MYLRMTSGTENLPCAYAYIEFTNQPAVPIALQNNGIEFKGRCLRIQHSRVAIIKPERKTADMALQEVEEAIRVNQNPDKAANALSKLNQGLGNFYFPQMWTTGMDRSYSPLRRSGSPRCHRSRSSSRRRRSRSRSKSRRRHRSKSKDRRSHSRSREHRRRSHSRHRRLSRSRDRKEKDKEKERRDREKEREKKERKRSRSRTPHKKDDRHERDKDKEKERERSSRRSDNKSGSVKAEVKLQIEHGESMEIDHPEQIIASDETAMRERLMEKVLARNGPKKKTWVLREWTLIRRILLTVFRNKLELKRSGSDDYESVRKKSQKHSKSSSSSSHSE
ncbi:CBN-RSP-7 protein [Dirofilaria immitis]|nr:CBN-RSP-7 protein [Dirofilaria immitis]